MHNIVKRSYSSTHVPKGFVKESRSVQKTLFWIEKMNVFTWKAVAALFGLLLKSEKQ